jgi:hypothetical protein
MVSLAPAEFKLSSVDPVVASLEVEIAVVYITVPNEK